MKIELTQNEMENLTKEGKTHIWAYNTLYVVDYSRNLGKGEYYIRKLLTRPYRGMGVTKRGRFVAMKPDEALGCIGV